MSTAITATVAALGEFASTDVAAAYALGFAEASAKDPTLTGVPPVEISTDDRLPVGVFPTMITPFTADQQVDWPTLEAMIEWYIACGCSGLFAVCLSSEMYNFTDNEKIELAKFVYAKAAGRAKVVASGTYEGTVEEQAAFVNRMAAEVDAVVVLINQMAKEKDSNEVWKANVQKLLDLTGNVPLGLYECPVPYHRLIDAETLAWCAASGRFLFHKDTCSKAKPILDKIQASTGKETPFRFYNANVATLQFSVNKGASGFSGICANFYPQLVCWLCANPTHPRATDLQNYLSVAENVVMYKYPRCAKVFQSQFAGSTFTAQCRKETVELNEEEQLKLESLHTTSAAWCAELGLPRLNPYTGKHDDTVPNTLATL